MNRQRKHISTNIMRSLFCLIFTMAITNLAVAQSYNVAWGDLMGLTVNANNTLTKAGATGWNASAVGLNILNANADGFVEFTWAAGTNNYVVGLARLNNDMDYVTIDFGLQLNSGAITVREYSVSRGSFGTAVAGNVFRISREAGIIKYYKDNVLFFTSPVTAIVANAYNLRPDVSVNLAAGTVPAVTASFDKKLVATATVQNPGPANNDGSITVTPVGGYAPVTYQWNTGEQAATISNKPRGDYYVTITDGQGRQITKYYSLGYSVAMTNAGGVTVNADNTLLKSGGANGYNAGASSLNILPENTNGWIEIVVNNPTATYVLGLARSDRDLANNYINSAWQIGWNGVVNVMESGTATFTDESLITGDVIRLAREGSSIKYYRNGVLKKTSPATASHIYVVDVSIHNTTGIVPAVTASFDKEIRLKPVISSPILAGNDGYINMAYSGTYGPGSLQWMSNGVSIPSGSNLTKGSYTATVSDNAAGHTTTRTYGLGYRSLWTYTNASMNADNSLTKTGAAGYNAGVISLNSLPGSTDGWVEFVTDKPNQQYQIGLARTNANTALAGTDYGFLVATNGDISIYEIGVSKGIVSNFKEGDVYRVARNGSNIIYYKNGIVLKTTALTATTIAYVLYADVCLHTGGSPSVTISFPPPAVNFYAIANGLWSEASTWSLTEGGAAAATGPTLTDNIYIKGYTVTLTTNAQCVLMDVTVTTPDTGVVIDGPSAQLTVAGNVKIRGQGNSDVVNAVTVQNNGKINVINP